MATVPLLVFSAAGLIAGTVPTIGKKYFFRTSLIELQVEVLQATIIIFTS